MKRLVAGCVGVMSLALVGIATAQPAGAVANGRAAAPGQHPFAVKLTMTHIPRADGTFHNSACSAALIAPSWVITAGHCFHDVNHKPISGPVPYKTTATLQTTDLSKSAGETRRVTFVRQSGSNDVALVKLSSPVTDVTPLAVATTTPRTATIVTLAGWGASTDVNAKPSTKLSLGQMKISSVRAHYLYVTGYAPAANTSACLYDSGAPYFTTSTTAAPQLVGVESEGPDCPHTTPETVGRVDNIRTWIATVVTDLRRLNHSSVRAR